MGTVYWIEDEKKLLSDFAEELADRGHNVVSIENASDAVDAIAEMSRSLGPIIVDLFLPAADLDVGHGWVRGHEVGLDLLRRLRRDLGAAASLFVVSGNIDLTVEETLIDELGVDMEWIFEKPLNDSFKALLKSVHNAAVRCSA